MAVIRPCRGSTEDWQKVNPILDEGEVGVERKTDGTCVTRIGNGKNHYFDLPILSDSSTFPKLNETADKAEQAAATAQEAAANANEVYEKLKDTDVSNMENDVLNLKVDLKQQTENMNSLFAVQSNRIQNLPVKKKSFRYMRDCLNGGYKVLSGPESQSFNDCRWVSGEVYSGGKNIALGIVPSANFFTFGNLPRYTNGNNATTAENRIDATNTDNLWLFLQLDFGKTVDVDCIKVYHDHRERIAFHHKLLVSDDGEVWYTIFDSEQQGAYTETEAGRTHYLDDTYIESQLESIAEASKIEDTGWVKLQLLNGFETYSIRPLRIRRVGNLVEIRGEIRAAPDLGIIALLPTWGIPSVRVCTLQQGGEYNIWMLNVYSYDGSGEPGFSGEITATRYRTGGTASKPPDTQEGHWMPIHVTYYVD